MKFVGLIADNVLMGVDGCGTFFVCGDESRIKGGTKMGDIIIERAPGEYQRYLTIGDAKGNFNKKVDTVEEAQIAAEEFCQGTFSVSCQNFLKYLEQSGYHISGLKTKLLEEKRKEVELPLAGLNSHDYSYRRKAINDLEEIIRRGLPPELMTEVINALMEKTSEDVDFFVRLRASQALTNIANLDIPLGTRDKIIDHFTASNSIRFFLDFVKDKSKCIDVRINSARALENLAKSNIPIETKEKMVAPLIDAFLKVRGEFLSLKREHIDYMDEYLLKNIITSTTRALAHLTSSKLSLKAESKLVGPLIMFIESTAEDLQWREEAQAEIINAFNILLKLNISSELKSKIQQALERMKGKK